MRLLITDINLPPIWNRFQVMADYWSGQIFASNRGCFTLMPSLGVIPCKYPDTFTSSGTRMIVLPDAENRTIISWFAWTKHRNVTDGQNSSDYYNGLHCEQCGRAVKTHKLYVYIYMRFVVFFVQFQNSSSRETAW